MAEGKGPPIQWWWGDFTIYKHYVSYIANIEQKSHKHQWNFRL